MVKLNPEEIHFLMREFDMTKEEVTGLDGDALLEIQDRLFDIELEGELSESRRLPKRCRMATDIITKIDESL